jgi:hypothetical protein
MLVTGIMKFYTFFPFRSLRKLFGKSVTEDPYSTSHSFLPTTGTTNVLYSVATHSLQFLTPATHITLGPSSYGEVYKAIIYQDDFWIKMNC